MDSDSFWETNPKAWMVRARRALDEIDLSRKAVVTVRCGNEGCGRALGYLHSSSRGPLWVPLVTAARRATDIDMVHIVLLNDIGLPADWRDELVGCRKHFLGTITKSQLLDAWEEAQHRGRRISVLLQHQRLYGNKPGEEGDAVGTDLTDAEVAAIRDEPTVSY